MMFDASGRDTGYCLAIDWLLFGFYFSGRTSGEV